MMIHHLLMIKLIILMYVLISPVLSYTYDCSSINICVINGLVTLTSSTFLEIESHMQDRSPRGYSRVATYITLNPFAVGCKCSFNDCFTIFSNPGSGTITHLAIINTDSSGINYFQVARYINGASDASVQLGGFIATSDPIGTCTINQGTSSPTISPTPAPQNLDDHNCSGVLTLPDGTNCCWFRQISNRCESIIWKTQMCEALMRINGISSQSTSWLIDSNRCLQGSTNTNPNCDGDFGSINLLISNCYTNGVTKICDLPKNDIQKFMNILIDMNLDVRLLYNFASIKLCYQTLNYGRFQNLNATQIKDQIININLTPIVMLESGSTIIYVDNPTKIDVIFKNSSLISQGIYITNDSIIIESYSKIIMIMSMLLSIKWV